MKAKETAKQLLSKFNLSYIKEEKTYYIYQSLEESKRCCLILIDEILEELDAECWGLEMDRAFDRQKFWNDVKQEIINFKK